MTTVYRFAALSGLLRAENTTPGLGGRAVAALQFNGAHLACLVQEVALWP